MATFGGITVDIMGGKISGLRNRVAVWEIPGLDGTGAIIQGKGNDGDPITLVRFGTWATIKAWFASVEATLGTIITVVDQDGDSISNVLVVGVSQLLRTAAENVDGLADGKRGECTATVIKRA